MKSAILFQIRKAMGRLGEWSFRQTKLSVWIGGALTLVWLTSCDDDKKKAFMPYDGPVEVIHNIRFLFSESGRVKVEMITPEQIRFLNETKLYPDTVNIKFYDDAGMVITTLRADSGRYDNSTQVYVVKGNVVVKRTLTNDVLKTSELTWNPNTKKVYNDKPNHITNLSNGQVFNGVGLDAPEDFSTFSMRKIADSRLKADFQAGQP